MSWIKELSPPHIQELVPYASAGRDPQKGEVWLNANENPYQRSVEGMESSLNRYPEFQPQALLEAYSDYAGCAPENLIVTRGIDEGIDLLLRAFGEPGRDAVVYTPPTYGMYSISAEALGLELYPIPLKGDFQLDIDAFKGAYREDISRISISGSYPKLIFLCSPNNPTGNLLNRDDVLKVLELSKGISIVVVDEAYIEFAPESSFMDDIIAYDNLVIARTLSKGFGLAGLRTGFLAANPEIIQILRKVSAPYPIPVPVVDVVRNALIPDGIERMQEEVGNITIARKVLAEALSTLNYVEMIMPSEANFVLLRVTNAPELMDYLRAQGIIIRDQSKQLLLENCVRITLGTSFEMDRLLEAMKAYGDRT